MNKNSHLDNFLSYKQPKKKNIWKQLHVVGTLENSKYVSSKTSTVNFTLFILSNARTRKNVWPPFPTATNMGMYKWSEVLKFKLLKSNVSTYNQPNSFSSQKFRSQNLLIINSLLLWLIVAIFIKIYIYILVHCNPVQGQYRARTGFSLCNFPTQGKTCFYYRVPRWCTQVFPCEKKYTV